MRKYIILLLLNLIFLEKVDRFNEFIAFDYLKRQCEFGPRFPGSDGHKKCQNYFESFLRDKVDTLYIFKHTIKNPYSEDSLRLTNFFGRFNPNNKERLLLLAHWDTRPYADLDPNPINRNSPIIGANDGASGVAVLMEIVNFLNQLDLEFIGVDILFVDGEDYALAGDGFNFGLGTKLFSKNIPDPRPRYAIGVDMVGDKDQAFKVEKFSYMQAPELVEDVWKVAHNLGYDQFLEIMGPAIIDDHKVLYDHSGIPSIDIIDFDYPNEYKNYWHTLDDTIDKCSPSSLDAVGETLIEYLMQYNNRFNNEQH